MPSTAPPTTPTTPKNRLYLDNAATSFPKPPQVLAAMTDFATRLGASPGRGAYAEAREAGQLLYQCRQRLNTLFNGQDPRNVVFTLNTSDALNIAIYGVLSPYITRGEKPHVITTHLDHNSVLRPYNELVARNQIVQTRIPCDPQTGLVDPADIEKAITPKTRLIAVVHGSNVTGTLQPIRAIGTIAREHAVPFLVDAAQTLGHIPIDVQTDLIDLLAFPGHKGLLGPLGTGGLYIRPDLEKNMHTTRQGGTGSVSELDVQPDFMPDRFETGSHNAIGIIGLSAAVQWILDRGVQNIFEHDRALCRAFIDGIGAGDGWQVPHLTYFGPQGVKDRCGVFSIRIDGYDAPTTLSDTLESRFGILTRPGIHCAPLAHETIGTASRGGTTRLSFGPFVTSQDVQYACDALAQIAAEQPAVAT